MTWWHPLIPLPNQFSIERGHFILNDVALLHFERCMNIKPLLYFYYDTWVLYIRFAHCLGQRVGCSYIVSCSYMLFLHGQLFLHGLIFIVRCSYMDWLSTAGWRRSAKRIVVHFRAGGKSGAHQIFDQTTNMHFYVGLVAKATMHGRCIVGAWKGSY